MEVSMVTWLRYTVWIPLYPLGLMMEGRDKRGGGEWWGVGGGVGGGIGDV